LQERVCEVESKKRQIATKARITEEHLSELRQSFRGQHRSSPSKARILREEVEKTEDLELDKQVEDVRKECRSIRHELGECRLREKSSSLHSKAI